MNPSNRFLIWGTMPLGAVAGAAMASEIGSHTTVPVCSLLTPTSALQVLFSAVRGVRSMPAHGQPEAPVAVESLAQTAMD